ncbi:unnamed protein product [Sphagnum jensenii]|uniref:SCP domain-containing protein n=1 Tax=Sphagnum jensenii TaxID=128206 RepID=A0ABP1BKU1_9BRYO
MASTSTLSLLLLITLILTDLSRLAVADDTSQAYLDPHNAARADVGVAPLLWNTTLENYALTYSWSQIYQTPLSRITLLLIPGATSWTHSGGPYGENLYDGYGDGSWTSPEAAVDSWVSEKIYYDEKTNTCSAPEGDTTRRCVWSSTTDLGCASVPSEDGSTFIMCSYYPPGNWDGERPY